MPELVSCPACGFKVQMSEASLGRQVSCVACGHRFPAAPDLGPAPRPPPAPAPRRPPAADEELQTQRPFCPGCGKRITWESVVCPHCGEELEVEDEYSRRLRARGDFRRRDAEPHRGKLIASLGTFSMIVGGLSVCLFGIGAAVSVPTGVVAWVMANNDLEQMRAGLMDPEGRSQTETGRTGGVVGILLGLVFAAFYAAMYLTRF